MSIIPQTAWLRALLVVIGVVVVFAVTRAFAVPASFGRYGYYRGASVDEWAARPASYSPGAQTCQKCHAPVYSAWSGGAHATINCETCHGPAGAHATAPGQKPLLPQGREFCGRCHAADKARPAFVGQVDLAAHNPGSDCLACHQPHDPALGGGGRGR